MCCDADGAAIEVGVRMRRSRKTPIASAQKVKWIMLQTKIGSANCSTRAAPETVRDAEKPPPMPPQANWVRLFKG
jgi:hypothetical protein